MKTELIKALKETVLDLRLNRKEYIWASADKCNCGILAQNILGVNENELSRMRHDNYGTGFSFSGTWSVVCHKTGCELNKVFSKLFSVGLTGDDIINLEGLSDPKILKEAGIPMTHRFMASNPTNLRGDKNTVIKYMEAWIRILEREEPTQRQETPTTIQQPELPNKSLSFVTFEEMREEMELLFSN